MRRNAKTDRNHADIIKALREIGCSVQSLHSTGRGCPDLLCGYHGRNILLEVKDGSLSPSADLMGETILRSMAGESFMLSAQPIWVRPVAVALSVRTPDLEGR